MAGGWGETERAASGGKGEHRARPGSLRPSRSNTSWCLSGGIPAIAQDRTWKGLEGKLYEDQLR